MAAAMKLPVALTPGAAAAMEKAALVRKLTVQLVFLATGVFSTCVAQFVFYQGAGDQKAMLLPLCNYLGMMLVGLLPAMGGDGRSSADKSNKPSDAVADEPLAPVVNVTRAPEEEVEPVMPLLAESMELTRRPTGATDVENQTQNATVSEEGKKTELALPLPPTASSFSTVQLCVGMSVVLDFAGCIFSNLGLSMAGSGLFQVVYSSVICWSALMSRFMLKKVVSKEEWVGIGLVTFGLAFSALGESSSGRNNTLVLMGCFNTLVGAAFYGGNYVTGEYTLQLKERPQPKELCLKIGTACVGIIAVYQSLFVLPHWDALVTTPITEAQGNTSQILAALVAYTLSQLAHGLTYFEVLRSSGAVTTGIMQSLRAVCVFALSSVLYCSQQESQCFDTKRGVATLIVVSGVMFYSWAKSQAKLSPSVSLPQVAALRRPKKKDASHTTVAGKNYVV